MMGHAAGAQDAPASWPCLAQRDDRAAYVAAFEAKGWTRVEGAARREAMLGSGEFQLLYHRAAANSWRVRPIEDRAAWEAEARALAELLNPPSAVVLVRGEATTVLSLGHSFDRVARVFCVMTAPDLPEADLTLAKGSRRLGTSRGNGPPYASSAGGGTLVITASATGRAFSTPGRDRGRHPDSRIRGLAMTLARSRDRRPSPLRLLNLLSVASSRAPLR
jgi:hypothetical protein